MKHSLDHALNSLIHQLQLHGLSLRGVVDLPLDNEKLLPPFLLEKINYSATNEFKKTSLERVTLLLVGHLGSSIWPDFSSSAEYLSGQPHPLDAWSQRIGNSIAEQFPDDHRCVAVFPSDGPPYAPFLSWSQLASQLQVSPLGLNLDPIAGLWHAFRFALIIGNLSVENRLYLSTIKEQHLKTIKPNQNSLDCSSCPDQPCLNACPINAFQVGFYDMQACATYLNNSVKADKSASQSPTLANQAACITESCLARRACPAGVEFTYTPEHREFHMQAFMKAHKATE